MTQQNKVILRFDEVSFSFDNGKNIILNKASFSIRENTKITIMGQNGAGKTTIFKLLMKELLPQKGNISIVEGNTVAIARQVIPRDQLNYTIREYFATAFKEKDYQLDKKIANVLKDVNLHIEFDKKLYELSGGQQARLLLAHALIQSPDILLLDEPTNNLDKEGIGDLIGFLLSYIKTVVVISHDADFLNMFTDGVLYLNKQTNGVEQYWGDYYDVLENISSQIEKERALNARMEKDIKDAKEKVNFFSNKGGKMRKLAKKMKESISEAEENKVEIRKDDKTLPNFEIEFENYNGPIVEIKSLTLMNSNHIPQKVDFELILKKKQKVILNGPNGIGKSTLLKRLIDGTDNEIYIPSDVRVGYYSQDFNALDFSITVWDAIHQVSNEVTDQEVYGAAGRFLLSGVIKNKIGSLSEGQKGLLCYARFFIQKPHLLILDEPTNHINFRHIPVIADAINKFQGTVIMVSHDQQFVSIIKNLESIELLDLLK